MSVIPNKQNKALALLWALLAATVLLILYFELIRRAGEFLYSYQESDKLRAESGRSYPPLSKMNFVFLIPFMRPTTIGYKLLKVLTCIPFGAVLCVYGIRNRRITAAILLGLLSILALHIVKRALRLGYFDVTDVLMNMAGIGIGCGLAAIGYRFLGRGVRRT